jgi:hypothetical protein
LGPPFVGFLERQRAGCPPPAVQEIPLPILDPDLHAPLAMIAELTIELGSFSVRLPRLCEPRAGVWHI